MKRREFIVGCSAAIAALAGSRITGYSFAPDGEAKDIFVYIFLRGGCDGLNLVAPVNDTNYVANRPSDLRITDGGDNTGLLLGNGLDDLDFRLHKRAPELQELYQSGALAVIHAAGLIHGTRSHFDAMDLIERGSVDDKNLNEGWFTRYLRSAAGMGEGAGVFASMAMGAGRPTSFLGSTGTLTVNTLSDYKLRGDGRYQDMLRSMYSGNTLLDQAARSALDSIEALQQKIPKDASNNAIPYLPADGVKYPDNNPLAKSLQTLAQIIKMDVGLQVAAVDYGGWDTHEQQQGVFGNLTEGLSKALGAFYNDLGSYQRRVTIMVMSEFGRRLKSNKSNGTDHGHGNVMFVLGGNVKGGKMYGSWPGLANEQLDNHVDLAVTSDYRSVLSEILLRRLGNTHLGYIFPGYKDYKPLDFMNGADRTVDYSARWTSGTRG
jgi:uncharacterized protein (DUF1501 family)